MTLSKSKEVASFARRRILELGLECGRNGAHFGSSLSLIDILAVLYTSALKFSKKTSNHPKRHRFILSKGHGALGYFSILEAVGFLNKNQTSMFEKNGSEFFAHAHKNLDNGIEYSGCRLGLGLTIAVGIAIANKLKKITSKVIVLIGDGECDEGIIWEAMMSAKNFSLDNLVIIVDRNGMQSDGEKKLIMNQFDLTAKFASFGFDAIEINGHDHEQILSAIIQPHQSPKAIIANTKKGYGIKFMENNGDWHHGILSEKLFNDALKDIE